jgi:hypothetical protein
MQSWHGTWRETYLMHTQRGYAGGSHRPIAVRGLYSDLLHQPWLCATMDMDAAWLEVENVDRQGVGRGIRRAGLAVWRWCSGRRPGAARLAHAAADSPCNPPPHPPRPPRRRPPPPRPRPAGAAA